MKIGSFVTAGQIETLAAAGADYPEFFLGRTVTNLDVDEFAQLTERAKSWPMRPSAYSGLLPATLRVTGPDIDVSRQDAHLAMTFSRMRTLSATDDELVVVFGSGDARRIPEGFDRDRALDQLEEFVRRALLLASDHRIAFAIEPLNFRESNVFNSVGETGAFITERSIEGALLLADLYHIMEVSEPLASVAEYGRLIRHTHIADTARGVPGSGTYPLIEFFEMLREVGYMGSCSIECIWDDFDNEVAGALSYVRGANDRAGI
jgi:sugar phosphate isomerase/epimerase